MSSYAPCQNKSCPSYGKPHPNCQCHLMAEGGKVEGSSSPSWDETAPLAAQSPSWDETKPTQSEPSWEDTTGTYGSTGQKVLTGLEGAAQGFAGPLATGAELLLSKAGVPGLSSEEIKGRQEENPWIHGLSETAGLGAGMLTGTGEAALVGKAALKAAELAKVGEAASTAAKIGSHAIKGLVEGGLLQAGDETSKAMLGSGDPNVPVSSLLANGVENILYGAGTGGLFGGLGGAASKALEKAGINKAGTYLHSFLSGLGESSRGLPAEGSLARGVDSKAYDLGAKTWDLVNKRLQFATPVTTAGYGAYEGYHEDGPMGALVGGLKGLGLGFGANVAGWAGKKALSGPAASILLKMISNGEMEPRSLFKGLDYANRVESGAQKINRNVENLFKVGGQQTINAVDPAKSRKKLDDWVGDGGIEQDVQQEINSNAAQPSPQGFAKGGQVTEPPTEDVDPIAKHLPEQNMLLSTAKGRISNYLKSLKPQKNQPKLAFDSEPDDRQKTKSYHRALDLANNPLSIMDKIKQGTIEPEHLTHFRNLYPELSDALQKKITTKISESQLKGEKPEFHVRQGLSMFMGTPLSGELSPQNIQAAQAVFSLKQPQQQAQPPTKNKKNTSTLSKADDSFMTGNQARIARQQSQK